MPHKTPVGFGGACGLKKKLKSNAGRTATQPRVNHGSARAERQGARFFDIQLERNGCLDCTAFAAYAVVMCRQFQEV